MHLFLGIPKNLLKIFLGIPKIPKIPKIFYLHPATGRRLRYR